METLKKEREILQGKQLFLFLDGPEGLVYETEDMIKIVVDYYRKPLWG